MDSRRFGPQGRVQGIIGGGQAPVHGDHFFFRHIQGGGYFLHLIGRHVALVNGLNLPLQLAQLEKQLLLRRRCADFTKDQERRMYS